MNNTVSNLELIKNTFINKNLIIFLLTIPVLSYLIWYKNIKYSYKILLILIPLCIFIYMLWSFLPIFIDWIRYLHVGNEILLIIFLVFILLGIMWYVSTLKTGSVLDKFTGKFSIISSVFIPIGIILTYRVFSLQYENMQRDSTFKIIDRGWFTINEKIVHLYNKAPNFIDSLFYSWQRKAYSNNNNSNSLYSTEYKKTDDWYAVFDLANRIFQSWEDFLTSSNIDQTDEIAWIVPFIQWASSPYLYKCWVTTRLHYSEINRQLGDYLFEVSLKNNPKNEEELYDIATKFVNSERYKKILGDRHA